MFSNLLPDTTHEVIPPPKGHENRPNTDEVVWVMGKGGPVRIFVKGRRKEAIIIE